MKEDIILHSHTGLGDQLVINGLVRSFFIENYRNIYIVTNPLSNEETLKHLYSDFEDRIKFVDADMRNDIGHTSVYELSETLKCRIFKLGFKWMWYSNTGIKFPGDPERYIKYNGGKNSIFNDKIEYCWPDLHYSYPRKFYSYLDQPYINRYIHAKPMTETEKSVRLFEQVAPKENYILVHNKTSIYTYTNLKLPNDKHIVYVDNLTDNLLDWITVIKNADEIHCVESSVFHLVDNISHSLKSKLFFHHIRNFNAMTFINCEENNNVWETVEYEQRIPTDLNYIP